MIYARGMREEMLHPPTLANGTPGAGAGSRPELPVVTYGLGAPGGQVSFT